MKYTLERLTDPTAEPVTLAEMKLHLREFDGVTDQDAEITGLIKAAREWVEDYTGRALVDQSWRMTIDGGAVGPWSWLGDPLGLVLPRSPVLALLEVATLDANGVASVLDPVTYEVRQAGSKWPLLLGVTATGSALRVDFRAGYVDLEAEPPDDMTVIPVRFKQAMKLWAEANYDRDEKTMELLLDVAERLVKSERVNLQLA